MASRFRAVVIGDEPALFAGRILADLGASVVIVEPSAGGKARHSPPFVAAPPPFQAEDSARFDADIDRPQSILWWSLTAGCETVLGDLQNESHRVRIAALLERADVLIEGLTPGAIDSLSLGKKALASRNPGLIQVSISPFGQDGPYRDWLGGDLVVCALGGLLSLVGDPDRPPVRIGAPQATLTAGAQGAVAVMLALAERDNSGLGQMVDVSAQAAVAWATHPTRQIWLLNNEVTRRSGVRRPFGTRSRRLIYPCADGHVAVQGVLGREWPEFVDWVATDGLDGPLRDPKWAKLAEQGGLVPGSIPDEALEELDRLILPFFARHRKRDLYRNGQRRRIIVFPVNDASDIYADSQLAKRDFWVETTVPGTRRIARVPGPPMRVNLGAGPRAVESFERAPLIVSEATADAAVVGPRFQSRSSPASTSSSFRPALAGLRVIDFSWVGAGPLTTALLAMHGAEVIRIESAQHPDVLRVTPPFLGGSPDIEASGYFHPLNPSKLGLGLNLATTEGRSIARRLVRTADCVVESFTPRVLARWGLDWDSLRQEQPDLVMLSLSMVGATGPERDYLGFGTVLQVSAGFAAITGWPDRDPVAPGLPYTDWQVPLLAAPALLAALRRRRETGLGQFIDCSQFEAALPFLGTTLYEYAANGVVPGRHGNRLVAGGHDIAIPHSVYQCIGEDSWLAVACYDDAQWRRLAAVVGTPPVGVEAGLDVRAAAREAIDEWLTAWLHERAAVEAAAMLQAHGVPAGPVLDAASASLDPGLLFRGFGTLFDTPAGPLPYDPPAFTLERTPAIVAPAPTIGQDTSWVMLDLLGIDSDEYLALVENGAIE